MPHLPFRNGSLFFICLGMILFFISVSGYANVNPIKKTDKAIAWHIAAQSVTYDNKKELYIAEDDVVITGGKTRLEADYIEFSNITKDALAKGNVLLISGEDSITCNEMQINLATEIGTIDKGSIFIQKNNFHINGENIKKTGKFSYSAAKGSITSCPGDVPDWKISGKNIEVTIDGYGTAENTVFWAKKMPVVYSPYLVFPVKTKRQTGFLLPMISSSDRKGFEYEQPFFWALNRHTDATFLADIMADRGVKLGAEYRYILNNRTKGSFHIDGLEDKKTDDGTSNTKNYRFGSTPQRTNTDRWWIRSKHNQELPNGFTGKLDLDIVSDEDYLHEFRDGFTGYDATKDHFEDEFGRSLDEYDDYTRKNSLQLSKNWSNYSFKVDTTWYDNVRARQQDSTDTTLQTLPSIQFDASKKKISDSIFYYSLESEYTSFYRKDTTSTLVNGRRTDIYPTFYLPVKLGRYINFEPSIGLRETIYHTPDFTDSNGDSSNFRTREMYNINADLSSKIIRIFNLDSTFANKMKHEIIPEVSYSFTPYIDQTTLPYFDSTDSVSEKNLITYSLRNNFITQKVRLDPQGKENFVYRDVAYLKLSQSYNIKKERDNESRPFSDITLNAELDPHRYFNMDADIAWDPYDNRFSELSISGTISDHRGDSIKSEYRYKEGSSESLYGRLNLKLNNRLSGFYSIETNLLDNQTVETRAGISYKKSCWRFDLFYDKTDAEAKVAFRINLVGIGEFGTK